MRRNLLTERCAELEVDALLVTKLANVRYLTGFTGSSAMVILSPPESVFFTDGRYGEQSRHEVPDLTRVASMENPSGLSSSTRDDSGSDASGSNATRSPWRNGIGGRRSSRMSS